MTMKPKARKYRIRRSAPLASAAQRAQAASAEAPATDGVADSAAGAAPGPRRPTANAGQGAARLRAQVRPEATDEDVEDGFGTQSFPTARSGAVESPAEVSAEEEIAAIRKEGLTGRQLRMARRLAQQHGLAATSDFDAVRLLRARGIDPFDRSSMLQLVKTDPAPKDPQLPQTVTRKPSLPSTELAPPSAAERADEIRQIQRDIARRRRRKLALLFVRLAFFVGLPTLLAGWYYYFVATPMYATKTEFVIQQAEPASAGNIGGLFSGTAFATSQDSITVQGYLQSRDAMLRLDQDLGFKAHFSQPFIDPIQRLPENASNEQAYKVYQDRVKIGYDPTEGIIKMEVSAADPQTSAAFSEALIAYAEEQVDDLTQRLRKDQMSGARESFEEAEAKMEAAQSRVLELQEQLGVLDPISETSALMSQITNFETQLGEKRLQLQQLLDNRRPNQARVDGVRGDIARLEALIGDLRSQMTVSGSSNASLARISGQLRMAEVDLQTRTLMMQAALQQLETARIEANRQTRYLSMGVRPVAPDEPTYPKAFENTVLAFLIFSGIYLMISLTASILREQVSA